MELEKYQLKKIIHMNLKLYTANSRVEYNPHSSLYTYYTYDITWKMVQSLRGI